MRYFDQPETGMMSGEEVAPVTEPRMGWRSIVGAAVVVAVLVVMVVVGLQLGPATG